jgi:hypothetical protein
MDPFVEDPKLWPGFQHQFVASLYQILLPGLVDRYRARVASRTYTTDLVLFTSVTREQHAEEYVEIRDRTDGRLVTLIDVVSPANKTTAGGRAAYLETRAHATAVRAAAVEIDLVTQGTPTLEFSRDGLPEYDYAVTVTRAAAPGRYEIYTATVQKRLPKFKLPLAANDRDALLDLQDVFRRAYDVGGFHKLLDYRGGLPADVRLTDANREWVDETLRQQKYR